MDIQRPILYNPTDHKVEISVHIICIDSENIYCIIHPAPPSDSPSLGSQAVQSLDGNAIAAVQTLNQTESMTSKLFPPLCPRQVSSLPTGAEQWDQFSGFSHFLMPLAAVSSLI